MAQRIIVMRRVRVELTTLGLWDLRAAYCAITASKHLRARRACSLRGQIHALSVCETGLAGQGITTQRDGNARAHHTRTHAHTHNHTQT